MSTSDIDKLWSGKTKIIPVWKLKIQVEPMITIGEKMFSAEKYSEFAHGMKSAQDLNFEILYDNKIVGGLTFPDNQTQQLTIELEDTRERTEHVLKFKMLGKIDEHSYHTQDLEDVSWVLKFNFWIEDLPMRIQFYKLGQPGVFVMGENSEQTMCLTTPIYAWLLEHSNNIVQNYQLIESGQDQLI